MTPSDAAQVVSACFDDLVRRRGSAGSRGEFLSTLNDAERAVWYIVSTRCEIDQSEFKSLFDQLFTERDVVCLIESLDALEARDLAVLFREAKSLLAANDFFKTRRFCSDLPEPAQRRLAEIGDEVETGDRLWELNEALARLLG